MLQWHLLEGRRLNSLWNEWVEFLAVCLILISNWWDRGQTVLGAILATLRAVRCSEATQMSYKTQTQPAGQKDLCGASAECVTHRGERQQVQVLLGQLDEQDLLVD